jgi:hypothetical protein
MIELRKVRDDPKYAGNLVPGSWELVCRPRGGAWQTVARHVASFDLRPDGAVVYTNGYELTEWRNGVATPIGRHELVETVVAG